MAFTSNRDSKSNKSSKGNKLAALAMPSKRGDDGLEIDLLAGDEEHDPHMDLSEEEETETPEEESEESPEYQEKEEKLGVEKHSPLTRVSDDELLAELRKRGLDKDLEDESNSDDTQGGISLRA